MSKSNATKNANLVKTHESERERERSPSLSSENSLNSNSNRIHCESKRANEPAGSGSGPLGTIAQQDKASLALQANGRLSSASETSLSAEIAKRSVKNRKKWNRRMKMLFCCLGYKKNKDSIADVASIFAEFYSDLNAPSSDIAAGFVLLSKYQAAQRQWVVKQGMQHGLGVDQYLSGVPIRRNTKFLDISTAEDSHLVNELVYYMNYSLAIFGWPLQVLDDPCMLCCIYPYLRLAPCCGGGSASRDSPEPSDDGGATKKVDGRYKQSVTDKTKAGTKTAGHKLSPTERQTSNNENAAAEVSRSIPGRLNEDCDNPIILEDNCCSCNVASAERRLAQHNYEIIYISYKSNVNVVPFLVAADHSKRTIVVAIRGSMSLSDMVTDMNGTVDKFPIETCPDDWLCHRGITRASEYVKTTLLQERILERAFDCRPDLASHEYNLVLCGHSLGAGAAAILGILLRARYPLLKAYLYSPPGGMLSLPVVEYTKQFATGVILGNDTVARLGVAQLERLRYHTLLSLKSAQKSPGRILARALCPSMCFGTNEVDYDPEQSLDLLHGTDGRAFDYNETKIPFQVQPQVLYVPGKLVHIVKNYSFRSKTRRLLAGPIYQAVWTENTDYDRVMISEGMFLDHLPYNVMSAMKMLFSKTLPGRRELDLSPDCARKPVAFDSSSPVNKSDELAAIGPHFVIKNGSVGLNNKDENTNFYGDDERSDDVVKSKNVISDDNNNSNSDDLNNTCGELKEKRVYPNLKNKIDLERKRVNDLPPERTESNFKKGVDINGNERDS